MANLHEKNCFWYSQNQCHLRTMEKEMVFSILSRTPRARESLLQCGFDCSYVDIDYLTFAETKGSHVEDETISNARFTKPINQYRDRHKLVEANSTLPKPTEDE